MAKKKVARSDILIEVMVTMPNGDVTSKDLRIVNPSGCILKSQLTNAEAVYGNLISGMASIYGSGHIK